MEYDPQQWAVSQKTGKGPWLNPPQVGTQVQTTTTNYWAPLRQEPTNRPNPTLSQVPLLTPNSSNIATQGQAEPEIDTRGPGFRKSFRSQGSQNWYSEKYAVREKFFSVIFSPKRWGNFDVEPDVDAFSVAGSSRSKRWWGQGSL